MKFIAQFAACLLALTLTACAAAPESQSQNTAATTEAATAAPQPAALTYISTLRHASMGKDAIYIAMNVNDEGRFYATTVDFTTGQQTVLCRKDGCTHTDDTCPAYMASATQDGNPNCALIPTSDKLYWTMQGPYGSDTAYVDISNLDGTNRHRVAEGAELPDLSFVERWYDNGEALYYTLLDGESFDLIRIDETGVTTIGSTPIEGGEAYFPMGCYQNEIVIQRNAGYQSPAYDLENKSEEELQAEAEAERVAMMAQEVSLYLLDTSTGKLTPTNFRWTLNDGTIDLVRDGIAYVMDENGHVLQFDLSSGATTDKQIDFPDRATVGDAVVSLGSWVSVWVDGTDLNDNGACLLNMATGEYRPQPTLWFKEQYAPRPAAVVAANDTMVFAAIQEIDATQNALDPDGVPYTASTAHFAYGLMSMADYLTGSQDWRPVTLCGRDIL